MDQMESQRIVMEQDLVNKDKHLQRIEKKCNVKLDKEIEILMSKHTWPLGIDERTLPKERPDSQDRRIKNVCFDSEVNVAEERNKIVENPYMEWDFLPLRNQQSQKNISVKATVLRIYQNRPPKVTLNWWRIQPREFWHFHWYKYSIAKLRTQR